MFCYSNSSNDKRKNKKTKHKQLYLKLGDRPRHSQLVMILGWPNSLSDSKQMPKK